MGVLEALEEEERALKAKVKERAQAAVAAGYERRMMMESRKAQRPSSCTAKSFRPASSQQKQEMEDTEEARVKWDGFLFKNDMFQLNREKHLADQRKKKEEQEVSGCTFKPQNPKGRRSSSNVRCAGGTMFDRARHMEARKQERMNQIRQELERKEMSQCSFHPATIDRAGFERGTDQCSRLQSVPNRPPTAGRPPAKLVRPSHSARRPKGRYASSMGRPDLARNGYAARSAEESSEASGTYDDMSSYDGDTASDITTLRPGAYSSAEAGYIEVPEGGIGEAYDESPDDLVILQRLQQRRRLLEETLSPDPASINNFEFGEVVGNGESAQSISDKLRSSPAAAVAQAVQRMEALLLGGDCDFSDDEESEEESAGGVEDGMSQSNDWPTSANAMEGKLRSASRPRPPASPSRGGG
jgi:hypothetical protein